MKNQAIDPFLQRESNNHIPIKGVDDVINIFIRAEQGDIIDQADLFEDMEERDAHIGSEMAKRKSQVAQLDWCIEPSKRATDADKVKIDEIEDLIEDVMDIESIIFSMADAIGKGFACLQLEWAIDEASGLWFPSKVTQRPQRWFVVDQETRLNVRLRDNSVGPDGAELIPDQWIVHEHYTRSAQGPTKSGLFRQLGLPYVFKNFAIKNWLRFVRNYGLPLRILFSYEKDEKKKSELKEALYQAGASGVALIEGGTAEDLKTVDLATGEGHGFEALINWCERAVSRSILGGTLTSSTGDNGNYATANVHDDARLQIRNHDAKQIAETLTNQLFGAICRMNGLKLSAKWVFDTQEPEDLALYADAVPKLVGAGVKIPSKWISEKLKIPVAEDGDEVLTVPSSAAPQPTQPEEKKQPIKGAGLSAIIGKVERRKFTPQQETLETLADDMNGSIKSPVDSEAIGMAIRAATSPEDLEARLAAVLDGVDLETFSIMMERALFAADVMGYAHAEGQ